MRVPIRPHLKRTVVVPRIAHALEPLPLGKAALQPHLLIVWRRRLEVWDVGAEVDNLGHDIKHALCPELLVSAVLGVALAD